MNVRFDSEAVAELAEAVAYYDESQTGLGSEFAAEVSDGRRRIAEHPNALPLVEDDIRRYRLNRFPYGLVYMVHQSEIIVLAVMHLTPVIGRSGRSEFDRCGIGGLLGNVATRAPGAETGVPPPKASKPSFLSIKIGNN